MNLNLKNVQISGIRKFYNEVKKIDGAISLTLGQPDFPVPKVVKEALINAVNEDKTVYTENAGILPLRKEISQYLMKRGIDYSADEICITVGGSEAIFTILTALINEGDNVLIPTPAYPAYENIVNILGGNVVSYGLNDDFSINIENLKALIKENQIKVLVLSLPSNPLGTILTKEEKDELIKIIANNNIFVVTDEIYESLIYEEYYSVAEEKEILDKVIYISGFSKMFSMTGLRVGYFAAQKQLMDEIMKVHQYNVSCATSICQWAALEGLRNGLDDVENMRNVLRERKDYVISELRNMGLEVNEPKGAFYVFPSIKKFNMSSEEFCLKLLNEEKIACVPGSSFGIGGEGYIRISYCYSMEELKKALLGLKKFINKI
ncbi:MULTISPECIES: pyridoxal phosphate-dependent aminotransferase [Clostridia]|uniref:Aminotransferase n=2 Tax=Clostridia TaxID=186801 RepID=A0A8I0A800_9CLOT|nr:MULTISPECIES: aminotransferase class I/II-fold pyridoxal phosphate-dependent enzyme [Clostridia]MBC5639586.1 aminotransferase class I/II-fold pyridoxal phosphate-dependent enzyme [Clostridium lentum]MBC5653679.1 aminotransferase class I/II-fold pyridoxal phosphate-dependent enzyme [Blautia lenta]MEE0567667.1 aminotransferase class I/II-fold pyridoxal phosphate-dependent enzyme [Clostridium sp.]OKZ85123.1 MAG: aspartate aminotransferase [Clostridium sp. 29_15]CDB75206.1 aminotransferase clas